MRVSRWLLGLTLLLAVIVPAQAQQAPPTTTKTLTSATCPGTGCLIVGSAGYGGLGVQVSGTFSATIVFEGIVSGDTTGTYTAVTCTPWNSTTGVTSTTAAGLWGCPVGGLSFFRVRVSSYTSGSAVITTLKAPTLARGSSGGGGGGGIGGGIGQYEVAVGSGTDTITGIAPGTSGYVLTSNGAGANPTYQAAPGGTPGSPTASVQFNNAGSFAGSDDLLWDGSALAVGLSGASSAAYTLWSGFPMVFLQELSGGLTPGFVGNVYSATANDASGFFPMRSRGTAASPTAVLDGDNLGVFEPSAHDGSNFIFPASFQFRATDNFATNYGTKAVLKVTSDGTAVVQDKSYEFTGALFTAPGGMNAAGGAFTVDGSGNLTVAGCTGCGASAAFSSITSGTNTTAAMVVGTGGSLAATGSGTIAATAVPVGGISGLGTGVATFLATPSSANLRGALTDETGSGAAVFGTSPTFTTSATFAGGTVTSSAPVLGVTQTWNSGAVVFTGELTNITATASAAESKVFEYQVGGTRLFSMRKDGTLRSFSVGTAGPSFTDSSKAFEFGTEGDAGYSALVSGQYNALYHVAADPTQAAGGMVDASFSATGTGVSGSTALNGSVARVGALQDGQGVGIYSTGFVAWNSSATDAYVTHDLFLYRGAADTLAQYRSTNAQAFNIYNTRTDASNGEWGAARWVSNVWRIGTNKNGTGTARVMSLDFGDGSTSAISIPAAAGQITMGAGFNYGANYNQFTEMTAPAAGATNTVRIYAEDNGAGKTRLMAIFPTGAAQQIAIEP